MQVQFLPWDLNPSPLHPNTIAPKTVIYFVTPLPLEKIRLCLGTEKARQHKAYAKCRLEPSGSSLSIRRVRSHPRTHKIIVINHELI